MAAYVIVDVKVTDPAGYEKYKQLAPAAIARHGGRYLARGGKCVVLEGDAQPNRVVVLEFPDQDAARRWYDSAEYRAACELREGAAEVRMIAVEGV